MMSPARMLDQALESRFSVLQALFWCKFPDIMGNICYDVASLIPDDFWCKAKRSSDPVIGLRSQYSWRMILGDHGYSHVVRSELRWTYLCGIWAL